MLKILIIIILILIGAGALIYLIQKIKEENQKETLKPKKEWRKLNKKERDFFFPPKD